MKKSDPQSKKTQNIAPAAAADATAPDSATASATASAATKKSSKSPKKDPYAEIAAKQKKEIEQAKKQQQQNPEDTIPVSWKVITIVATIFSVLAIAVDIYLVYYAYNIILDESLEQILNASPQALSLSVTSMVFNTIQTALFIVFAIRIFLKKRRWAARLTTIMLAVAVCNSLLFLMLTGVSKFFVYSIFVLLFLITAHTFLDTTLVAERKLQRLRKEEQDLAAAKQGMLGRDLTGKGYIKLNFYNIFWIFVVACVIGWGIEMVVCPFLNNKIENRAGLLFGPFSPIYGFGALLMTIALNRFYKSNPLILFGISALIGGAFEFFVSYFLQYSFGILAWDYAGEPFNIMGRTDLLHMVCWGILGLLFVRLVLPHLLKLINKIPWGWRYGVTVVCFVLMLVNGVLTLLSFDCWYQRVAGHNPDIPVAQFFATNFDNSFMQERFSVMSIDPNRATPRD